MLVCTMPIRGEVELMDTIELNNSNEPTSLYSKLKEYGQSDFYPYHMPGHKRNSTDYLPYDFSSIDITEIDGFDNLHNPEGIIKEAEIHCANACGADNSFFLVNGSTCGVIAAISSAVPKGGKLIIARNAHKSAYYAMTIRDIHPSYVYPKVSNRFGFCEALTAEEIIVAVEQNPDAAAVFVVSPTYEGRLSDIEKIAQIVHEKGMILIVDEAHGAHLSYAKDVYGYGKDASRSGADIVIQSTHKTLPAPTQTALLHVNGNRIDLDRLKQFLHIYMSSSPSYPLLAGIEGAVRLMEKDGERLLIDLRNRYSKLINDLSSCKYIDVLPYTKNQDVGKFVFSASRAGVTGKQLAEILRKDYHLEMEEAGEKYALAMFTVFDSDEGFERIREALIQVDESFYVPNEDLVTEEVALGPIQSEIVYSLAESFEMKKRYVSLDEAENQCAGDFINLYPPGTPILAPGERITGEHIKLIKRYLYEDLRVVGICEGSISTLA